ncbi:MAG: HAMP domain-containing protein, partial [Pseudonocardiaceae bacterium]
MSAQPASTAASERHDSLDQAALERILLALENLRDGNFRRRLVVTDSSVTGRISTVINQIAQRNQALVGEVVTVRDAVGQQGRTGQRLAEDSGGGWSLAAAAINGLIDDLTRPTTELARVLAAVSEGDLSSRVSDQLLRGDFARLGHTVNGWLDQLSLFAEEVTRVAHEVGSEGKLGGQARVRGVTGTWKALTDNVNGMADNLTNQVRSIATVATAVAGGDLSKKITVEARGEVAALAETINRMVDTLGAFADEVTRVAREVGTEGTLGGQAQVPNVAGIWKDLTDNVNGMADNLTSQVRSIATVTTAVANGDLSKKIDVDARGEILELKTTINTMVDRLSAFAAEVTRVAREVGTEGRLGGQAEVIGVSGMWQRLTENVNVLAGNLTTQVRAIATVATAVTAGDLTRQITVDASGEVAELKDNINQMVANLTEATRTNQEQDWLKTNLGQLSDLMQGHRDLPTIASLVLSELAPLVSAQQGAFFLVRPDDRPKNHPDGHGSTVVEFIAGYGIHDPAVIRRFALGESLVGQAALDKRTILVTQAPPDYAAISSGLGRCTPTNLVVLPLLFEDQALGVIELASVNEFTAVHRDLLERLREAIGVNVNTILATSRTEALLAESQRLTRELTAGRQEIEDRAAQLAAASRYKSDFMANMSHELRTPLNSALVLAKLLADNLDGNLSDKQVEFAATIHSAGSDLLQLINDILDLAKVEAGRMDPALSDVPMNDVVNYVTTLCEPLATEKALHFTAELDPGLPEVLHTDEQRLQQVLRNLMSNAVKFTDEGGVALRIRPASADEVAGAALRAAPTRVAFEVEDTGIGIAADKLSAIFEAFQQADGTT